MDFFNSLIETVFTLHPIHAMVVHFPIALGGAAFLFLLIAWWKKSAVMEKAAYYNQILTMLSIIVASATGIYDNITRWDDAAPNYELKILLGVIMFILSAGAVVVRWRKPDVFEQKKTKGLYITAYGVIFVFSIVLGYLGGVIVYGVSEAPQAPDTSAVTATPVSSDALTTPSSVSFSQDILPVFESHCTNCHNSKVARGAVALDSYANTMASGTVVAGDAAGSSLLDSITSGRMPPGKNKLTAEQVQLIVDWINQGALDN